VERIFAWLARYRRLSIRYECHADIHLAFTTLACVLVCLGQIRRFFQAHLTTIEIWRPRFRLAERQSELAADAIGTAFQPSLALELMGHGAFDHLPSKAPE